MSTLKAASLALASVLVVACSSPAETSGFSDETPKTAEPKLSNGTLGGEETAPGATTPVVNAVFGHSATTLYKMDPNTKEVTVIGDFEGCDGRVIDLAIDAASNMFASADGGLFKVSMNDARCTRIASGSYPNSLSFVPQGTVDANAEALVGYVGSDYLRIDPKTGKTEKIGRIGSGDLRSSGDIVSVKGGATYLTVTGRGCTTDCLIEVDPKSGAMVKNWGATGFGDVYGLAFWAGKVYGFNDGGDLFEISLEDGLTTTRIDLPESATALSFWGAGSTTSAPITSDPK